MEEFGDFWEKRWNLVTWDSKVSAHKITTWYETTKCAQCPELKKKYEIELNQLDAKRLQHMKRLKDLRKEQNTLLLEKNRKMKEMF